MGGTKVQPTEQQLAKSFLKEYNKLCKEHGYNVVATPAYIARDDGSFSTVVQISVGKTAQVDNTQASQ